jgi:predicted regulator of Ras-like GTPase activity (Roadblock/LC7/MglB family)
VPFAGYFSVRQASEENMTSVLARLRREAFARAAFVVDEDGEILASDSEPEIPLERLGLTAVEQIGGVEGLARLVGSPFGLIFHDATGDDMYISTVAEGRTLAVLFDQHHASLGTVRLRVKALYDDLIREISSL